MWWFRAIIELHLWAILKHRHKFSCIESASFRRTNQSNSIFNRWRPAFAANAANKPTCMNLLSDLAQICARFASIKQSDFGGYDGCMVIEPALLGTPQATYHMGCFNFYQGTVRQVEVSAWVSYTTLLHLEGKYVKRREETSTRCLADFRKSSTGSQRRRNRPTPRTTTTTP